jgi:hypothetical protein
MRRGDHNVVGGAFFFRSPSFFYPQEVPFPYLRFAGDDLG